MLDELKVVQGDTIEGSTKLREIDACDTDKENTFVIPNDAEITMVFPGTSGDVTIDSLTPNEITILDFAKGDVGFRIPPAKSALLLVGAKQTVRLIVDYNTNADRKTFKKEKFLTVTA